MMINGDAFKSVHEMYTQILNIYICFKFRWILTRKIYHPKCDFLEKPRHCEYKKWHIFKLAFNILLCMQQLSIQCMCVYSKPFYMYGFAYFITFCGKVEDSMEQHLTNPLSPYCERPTWAMSCFCFLQESGHMNIQKYAIQASFWSQT
jgi:hypothetical protein